MKSFTGFCFFPFITLRNLRISSQAISTFIQIHQKPEKPHFYNYLVSRVTKPKNPYPKNYSPVHDEVKVNWYSQQYGILNDNKIRRYLIE